MRAVLLDAMGTLLRLEPPAPLLRRELAARGIEVDAAAVERAMRAEIVYYRAHNLEGSDRATLADLRRRCAAVLHEALGDPARDAPSGAVHDALLAALRFTTYPDAVPALERLRAAGLRLLVVSNWDVSLHDRLAETGLAELLDGALASAELGVAKPDPAIFARALTMAGVPASEALHVGDSLVEDVEGARAAGVEAVLLARDGAPASAVRAIASLSELPDIAA